MANTNETFIFIPDISGFTEFVNSTEINHSQHIIGELLELIIDSNELSLEVSEVEGDAVLFYRYQSVPTMEEITKQARNLFLKFHSHLRHYETHRICECGACSSASRLTLKMVAHAGEIGLTKIKDREKLHGSDLILAHRLLKNAVPMREYLLISDHLLDGEQPKDQFEQEGAWQQGADEYDGLGSVGYQYQSLSGLRELVEDPPPLKEGYKMKDPVQVEAFIDCDPESVFEIVSNMDYRAEWNRDPKGFEYEHDRVNRSGTRHVCVFDNRQVELETTTADFGADYRVYGERTEDLPGLHDLITYFIVTPEGGKTRLRMEVHYRVKYALVGLIIPLFRRRMFKQTQKVLMQLKAVCEAKTEAA